MTRTWRTDAELADVVDGPADPAWETDRDLIDQRIQDPWTRGDWPNQS